MGQTRTWGESLANLPTLVFVYATHFAEFCLFCRTILHDSVPSGEFRHSEVNSESNIYSKLKNLLAHSLGNGSELLTHWHPSCGWHWSWPN